MSYILVFIILGIIGTIGYVFWLEAQDYIKEEPSTKQQIKKKIKKSSPNSSAEDFKTKVLCYLENKITEYELQDEFEYIRSSEEEAVRKFIMEFAKTIIKNE